MASAPDRNAPGATASTAPTNDAIDVEKKGGTSLDSSSDVTSTQHMKTSWREWLTDPICMRHVAYVPIVCSLLAGVLDSTMFNAYGTFVCMQTGNTILFALGASSQSPEPYGWAKSLIAVVCFVLGSVAFSRITRYLGPRRRHCLLTTFALQSMISLVSAAMTQSGLVYGQVTSTPTTQRPIDWSSVASIALMSFQSAGQLVEARNLGINEVLTVVVTNLLCDLASDTKLLAPLRDNVKRNRRAAAFVLTLLGAIAGGWLTKWTMTVASSLWLVGGVKMLIVFAFVMWPAADDRDGKKA